MTKTCTTCQRTVTFWVLTVSPRFSIECLLCANRSR